MHASLAPNCNKRTMACGDKYKVCLEMSSMRWRGRSVTLLYNHIDSLHHRHHHRHHHHYHHHHHHYYHHCHNHHHNYHHHYHHHHHHYYHHCHNRHNYYHCHNHHHYHHHIIIYSSIQLRLKRADGANS